MRPNLLNAAKQAEEPSPYDFRKWAAVTGQNEGFSKDDYAYLDSKGILTIGYGFNLEDPIIRRKLQSRGFDVDGMIKKKVKMTKTEALPVLEEIYKESFDTAKKKFTNFDTFPDDVKHVVTDMVFNMGESRFDGFKKMKAALLKNDYAGAAREIADSSYAKQVGNRAKKNMEVLNTIENAPNVEPFFKRDTTPVEFAPMREATSVSSNTPAVEAQPVQSDMPMVSAPEARMDSRDKYVWGPSGKMTVQDFVDQYGEKVFESTFKSPVPKFANGGLTLPYWRDLDKQYYINSDRTPREYKSGGWTDLDRRYGYYGQYPGYAYGSHVVHGGPTWPEYAMGLDSGATLKQTLDVLKGNPTPKILDTSAQGNMPKKAKYPSYYSQGVKKYSLPEEGRSLYGDGDTVDLKLPSNKKTVKSGMNLEGYLARYPIPTPGFNIIGGMNPMYYSNRFSVGPYLTGHAGTEGTGFNDYGMRGTYDLGKNLSVGTDLNPQGVRAGVQYKFEKGGSLTDEYRRVRSTIPRVSFDAPSRMYTGPTTQRGITFRNGGPTDPEPPVESGLATQVVRAGFYPFLPTNARQLAASMVTGDSNYGLQDAPEGERIALFNTLENARKRTGQNKGGTEYVDYGSGYNADLERLQAAPLNVLAGSALSSDFNAATTFGRVSYEYDPKTQTYKVYDSYDFSKTPNTGTSYSQFRSAVGEAAATRGISPKGKTPNYIGSMSKKEYQNKTANPGLLDFSYSDIKNALAPINSAINTGYNYLNKAADYFGFKDGGPIDSNNQRVYTDWNEFNKAKQAYQDSMDNYLNDKYLYESRPSYTSGSASPYDEIVRLADENEKVYGVRTPGYSPKPKVEVIFNPLKMMQPRGGVFENYTSQPAQLAPNTYPTQMVAPTVDEIMMPSGQMISRKEFIKQYGEPAWNKATNQGSYKKEDGGWLDSYEKGGMIKRADGSYSRRGLWDNIRANRGSGKKPTKEMLKQERKIRAAEKKADGSFVGIEPMTNLNIAEPRYNKTPDKAVMPVVYANEPNTPDWSKGAKFANGGYTNKNKNNWLDNL